MASNRKTYANRGQSLEMLLENVHNRYRNAGIAVIVKQHTHFLPIRDTRGMVRNVKVEEKAVCDYLGTALGVPVAVEAKSTKANRLSYSEVQPHQAAFMDDWEKQPGAVAMVVVSFNDMQDFFCIPWRYFRAARQEWAEGRKGNSVRVKVGLMELCTNGKASVSPEDLPGTWRVEIGGSYYMDYLLKMRDSLILEKKEVLQEST